MAFVAPWLNPPNFLGAMHAGAQVGLQERAQNQREELMQDRLKMAYDALAAREQHQANLLQSRYDLAANALQARQAQEAQAEKNFQQNMDLRERRLQDLTDYRNALLEGKKDHIHFGAGGLVQKIDENGNVVELHPGTPSTAGAARFSIPLDPNNPFGPKLSGALSDPEIRRRFDEASAKAAAPPVAGPQTGWQKLLQLFKGTGAPPAAVPNAPQGVVGPSPQMGGAPVPLGPPAPNTPISPAAAPMAPASPFKEGALIRKKGEKDLFRVINGVPTPVDANGQVPLQSAGTIEPPDEDMGPP